MKSLFDELSFDISTLTTRKYSTSFSLGILALSHTIRPHIYSIYGFVRLADEIVDSFHGYNKKNLLYDLKRQVNDAIHEKISINPILNAFQDTVNKYNINTELISQFLHSMEMDLDPMTYNPDLYEEYILGSAEVVGLMCLHVFTEGDEKAFSTLKPYAMKLGSAFQKLNFLRDMGEDYELLGRIYFPNIDISMFNDIDKHKIEQDISTELKEALVGIQLLPSSSRFGVYLAYSYYTALLSEIHTIPAKYLISKRVRIHNAHKLLIFVKNYVKWKAYLLRFGNNRKNNF